MAQHVSQADIGRALDLSKAAISKLKGQGMPVYSIDAARQWRRLNQELARRKPEPAERDPSAGAADALRVVQNLMPVADAALAAGRFDLIAPAMRAALRAVPLTHRGAVELSFEVMDALVHRVAAMIDQEECTATLTDGEAQAMGAFWYCVAAGEPAAIPSI